AHELLVHRRETVDHAVERQRLPASGEGEHALLQQHEIDHVRERWKLFPRLKYWGRHNVLSIRWWMSRIRLMADDGLCGHRRRVDRAASTDHPWEQPAIATAG